ncbi:MAG: DNA methyltransferase [Dehalogenimonas sp.]|uniref:DNA methyltransferase n=1 Tax=Candidatus Dehalogenimonas loeffleri TaxID=3127115 RepID=A0ABZ2JAL9_9CHLR|nr:DNA methyltransferase [Dehalogenimonas sp.]
MDTNVLYYGDNLEILRKHIPNESVDLIYLDPPFNSKRDYNILFKDKHGIESEAQIEAFTDSWHWTQPAQDTYQQIVTKCPINVSKLIGALHDVLGHNDVMAYLVMMTVRLVELHRVLKPTGSLYLHCDPTMSHYIKLVLDQIFGPTKYRNEIIWKRSSAHSDSGQGAKHLGRLHDTIFFYSKSDNYTSNMEFLEYNEDYVSNFYKHIEPETGRTYRLDNLAGPGGAAKGNPQYEFLGVTRYWRYSQKRMQELYEQGRIIQTRPGAVPAYKRYLDEMPGTPLQDIWDDLGPIGAQATERLGYPTQKPLALLERIIKYSTNEGDIVLDPFCGCGTAIVAAQKLKRRWIGIDVTHLAINLMRMRLKDTAGLDVEVIGEPADLDGARDLARRDKYQFQWWALGTIGARPYGEKKKGADHGVDGVITFIDDPSGKPSRVIVQVKGGHVGVKDIRELQTVAADEAIGVYICIEPATANMKEEAIAAGYYHSPVWNKDYPKIQILTVEDIMSGKSVEMPPQAQVSTTFAKAQRVKTKQGEQGKLS